MPKSVIFTISSLLMRMFCGLDIGVDQLRTMREAESGADLDPVIQSLVEGQGAPRLDQLLKVIAFDHLHDDVVSRAIASDIMHCHDIRMRHHRDAARLLFELLDESRIVLGQVRAQNLNRHHPPQHAVERAINDRHAARALLRHQFIALIQ